MSFMYVWIRGFPNVLDVRLDYVWAFLPNVGLVGFFFPNVLHVHLGYVWVFLSNVSNVPWWGFFFPKRTSCPFGLRLGVSPKCTSCTFGGVSNVLHVRLGYGWAFLSNVPWWVLVFFFQMYLTYVWATFGLFSSNELFSETYFMYV